MKKTIILIMLSLITGRTMAEVDCSAVRGHEGVKVKVIDTFLERTAFIKHVQEGDSLPVEEVGVEFKEKSKTLSFINKEKEFSLHIDKRVFERRMPPIYKGVLTLRDLSTEIDCIVE